MKKLLLSIVLLLSVANLQAQSISHIETTKNWYYIYDQDGKKTKTLSSTIGELQGFSASFFVVKSYTDNSDWYSLSCLDWNWSSRSSSCWNIHLP